MIDLPVHDRRNRNLGAQRPPRHPKLHLRSLRQFGELRQRHPLRRRFRLDNLPIIRPGAVQILPNLQQGERPAAITVFRVIPQEPDRFPRPCNLLSCRPMYIAVPEIGQQRIQPLGMPKMSVHSGQFAHRPIRKLVARGVMSVFSQIPGFLEGVHRFREPAGLPPRRAQVHQQTRLPARVGMFGEKIRERRHVLGIGSFRISEQRPGQIAVLAAVRRLAQGGRQRQNRSGQHARMSDLLVGGEAREGELAWRRIDLGDLSIDGHFRLRRRRRAPPGGRRLHESRLKR